MTEVGTLEIGAKINRSGLQNDIRSVERDLGKVSARAQQTTGSIERIGKSAKLAGASMIGMATAGVLAFSSMTKGSPYLVGEQTKQQIARTQIGLEGGKITLPIEQIKTELIQGLANLVHTIPEKLSGLFGVGSIGTSLGIAGGAATGLGALLGGASAGKLAAFLTGAGGSALIGGVIGIAGGVGGMGVNLLTDLIGLTNKNKTDSGSTIGRLLAQIGGGAAVGGGIGAFAGGIGAIPGAAIGALGGLISGIFQEINIRHNSPTQNRKYDETRQEYVV